MDEIKTKYIPWLEALHNDDMADLVVAREVESVLRSLKEHIDKSYKRPEGMYSKVRKAIEDKISHPPTLKLSRGIIKMNKAEYDASAWAMRKVVEMRNAKQTVFSLDYIVGVVEKLRKCVTFADRFCFLQLACGARAVELLDKNTSVFSDVGQNNIINQRGFAKKRGARANGDVTKPLLWTSAANFLCELQILRDEVGERGHTTRAEIAKSFSSQLVARCKDVWFENAANGQRTGTHINRSIYANVAYKSRGNAGESLTYFIKNVLGHEHMGTAASYMNLAVAYDNETALLQEASRQAEGVWRAAVVLENEEGVGVSVLLPPIRRMTPEQRAESLECHAMELRSLGVPVNRRNLISLGFQSKAIRKGALDSFKVDG